MAAKVGLSFSPVAGIATPIWPPSGIALAALLLFGTRLWPGIALGAFSINYFSTGVLSVALGISVGNTLEAVVAAVLLEKLGFDRRLYRYRDVAMIVFIAAFASTLISAAGGVFTSWVQGLISTDEVSKALSTWWIGDILGVLVITPFLLVMWETKLKTKIDFRNLLEEVTVYLVISTISLLFLISPTNLEYISYVRPNILYPVLLWAAFRLQQRGATTSILLISLIFTWGTAVGRGPFTILTELENYFSLQFFIGVMAITFLFVSALITQWRRAEEALRRAVDDRDEFLAIVSHDLKNPISTILLNAQLINMILDRNEAPRNLRSQIDVFTRAGNQMKNLVENVLDTAKVESGTFLLELKLVRAQSIVDESLEMFRSQANEKSIRIFSRVEDANYELYCDPYRTLQILSNLIGNALKFTPDGGTISISVKGSDHHAHFVVEDTGPGIPEEQIPHIFDRYWQGRNAGKSSIGLGLSIAKSIVDAHGGKIWVSNKSKGQGASIHFTLPISEQDAPMELAALSNANFH